MKIIFESQLNEDKTVKFNGEVSPRFGWCVILMGGAGSGKGYAQKNYFGIDCKVIDVDSLKDPSTLKKLGVYDDVQNELASSGKNTAMELGNADYVETAHKHMKPYTNKKNSQAMSMGKYADPRRLPNILFDITGKTFKKVDTIVQSVKPLGYKVAVVLVLADSDIAWERNKNRERVVPKDVFSETHSGVLSTLEYMFRSGYNETVDEFWCIHTTDKDSNKRSVVYNIKNGYKQYDEVINQIVANKNWVRKNS